MLKANAACLGQNLHSLGNLKILDITKNDIPDKAIKSLTTGMLLTPNLEDFKYNENLFSEDSTVIFKVMHELRTASKKNTFTYVPSIFKALVFILNCINDNKEMIQSLTSDHGIVFNIGLIKELNLSHSEPATLDYKLTSEDIKELYAVLRWLKSLEILDVRNNNITDEAMEPVVKIILQNCNLKITGNPICNDKFYMTVLDTINNARKEQVQEIACNQNNHSHIACQSIIYIMECLNELTNHNCFELFKSITVLDVDSKSSHAGKFLEYLTFLPSLRTLKINHVMCITNDGIIQLSKYLSQNRTLTKLDLSYCTLENLKFETVPRINHSLDLLKCNYSTVTDGLLSSFAMMIRNVNHLELEGNCFGDRGICDLHNVLLSCENGQHLLNKTMTTLILADNQLTSNSVVIIIEIVEKYKVEYLNVSHNQLNTFSCFENYTVTTLKELYLSDNSMEINEYFTNILQKSTQLEILDLENNKIANDTFKYLSTGYLFTSKLVLKNLRLNGNPCIVDQKNKSILKMIQKLYRDDYQHFKCPPEKFDIFLIILELVDSNNIPTIISRIEYLDVSYSDSSDQQIKIKSCDIKRFCRCLKYFKSLKSLIMCNNSIIKEDEEPLANAVLKNDRVIEIMLQGNPIYRAKECSRLFDTIGKMRTYEDSYCVQDQPETLRGLVDILTYVNTFDDKTCDITANIKHLDISNFCQPQSRSSTSSIEEDKRVVIDLICHLKLFGTLKTLNLSHAVNFSNSYVNVALHALALILKDNDTLLELDISDNNILAIGALIILESLKQNKTLRKLNLTFNKISGDKKCKEIAQLILNLDHIEVDILKGNEFTEDSKIILGLY